MIGKIETNIHRKKNLDFNKTDSFLLSCEIVIGSGFQMILLKKYLNFFAMNLVSVEKGSGTYFNHKFFSQFET